MIKHQKGGISHSIEYVTRVVLGHKLAYRGFIVHHEGLTQGVSGLLPTGSFYTRGNCRFGP